jgi:hypothetical protein
VSAPRDHLEVVQAAILVARETVRLVDEDGPVLDPRCAQALRLLEGWIAGDVPIERLKQARVPAFGAVEAYHTQARRCAEAVRARASAAVAVKFATRAALCAAGVGGQVSPRTLRDVCEGARSFAAHALVALGRTQEEAWEQTGTIWSAALGPRSIPPPPPAGATTA